MLTEVSKVNNDSFYNLEDTYLMNFGSDLTDSVSAEPMEVIIKCPHKQKKVSALMTTGMNISASATWEEIFGKGVLGTLKSGVETISGVMSWMTGQSVMQPWMNRKAWKSTSPFTVNIPISFVSTMGDAKGEVFDPCMALLSFLYPRQYGTAGAGMGTDKNNEATSADTIVTDMITNVAGLVDTFGATGISQGILEFIAKKENSDEYKNSVVGSMLNSFKLYNIPGPALNTQDAGLGDPVSIMIGPAFNLGTVYMKDVKIDFSKTIDPTGYPLAANVTLTVEPANACYCKPDGTFIIFDEWSDGTDEINQLMTSFSHFRDEFAEGATTITKNFIGTFQVVTGLF